MKKKSQVNYIIFEFDVMKPLPRRYILDFQKVDVKTIVTAKKLI